MDGVVRFHCFRISNGLFCLCLGSWEGKGQHRCTLAIFPIIPSRVINDYVVGSVLVVVDIVAILPILWLVWVDTLHSYKLSLLQVTAKWFSSSFAGSSAFWWYSSLSSICARLSLYFHSIFKSSGSCFFFSENPTFINLLNNWHSFILQTARLYFQTCTTFWDLQSPSFLLLSCENNSNFYNFVKAPFFGFWTTRSLTSAAVLDFCFVSCILYISCWRNSSSLFELYFLMLILSFVWLVLSVPRKIIKLCLACTHWVHS